MMYWLVTRYQICVNILDKGFNTVGLNYYSYLTGKLLEVLNIRLGPYNINFYSGNFFWFCSDYLKKLDEIIYLENRYSAETFILSKYEKNKHINLLDQRYFSPYTIDMPIKPLKESEIKLAIF